MKGIPLIMTLALGLFVAPLAAEAQLPTKVYRIGWLRPDSPPSPLIPLRRPSGSVCASSAISRARTSSWRPAMRRGAKSGSPSWQRNWSSSRWT
jgi:hypothetical protein